MNLASMLKERSAAGKPIRIGQIGAGKFGTMFLSQVRLTTGMHLVGLADLMPGRARERMLSVGWPKEQTEAKSMGEALATGRTLVTDDATAVTPRPKKAAWPKQRMPPKPQTRPRLSASTAIAV